MSESWNKKHNSQEKISSHSFTNNWKVVNVPIKVHPSEDYCNSGGIDCQYLRWKDVEKTVPFCAWNFEYRGSNLERKGPLKQDARQPFVVKANFCRSLSRNHWYSENSWENTEIKSDPQLPKEESE